MHYRGTLQDGTSSTRAADARSSSRSAEGQVIPGFENAVEGMEVGENKTVTIPPDEAYGEHFDEAVQNVPRGRFRGGAAAGEIVSLVAPRRQELMATVVSVDGGRGHPRLQPPARRRAAHLRLELVAVV